MPWQRCGKIQHPVHFSSVSWDIFTKNGGTYTVTTDYAIADPASTLFKLGYSINDKLTEFTFPGTGGWSRFVKHSPGVLTLPPGKCTLTVKGITSGAKQSPLYLPPRRRRRASFPPESGSLKEKGRRNSLHHFSLRLTPSVEDRKRLACPPGKPSFQHQPVPGLSLRKNAFRGFRGRARKIRIAPFSVCTITFRRTPTMSTPAPLSPSVLAPKPHYAALDGLRGVAAVMVVLFHMFEGSARDFQFHTDQIINHGYLSVDFFFMLSGFVIGMPMTTAEERCGTLQAGFLVRLAFNPWWSWGCC